MIHTISVIIPTYNEEKRLDKCLKSIVSQKGNFKLQIIVVDDGSTDQTVQIAKNFGAEVFLNGSHNIEHGKSIGLSKSVGEYIFLVDADNELTTDRWFSDCLHYFKIYPGLVGVQSSKYYYSKTDPSLNRYMSLFGFNDPLVSYLGKRGQMSAVEKKWMYQETVVNEDSKHVYVKVATKTLPTVGSQGFMTKKDLLLKTNWKPYLFHMDSIYQLVEGGFNSLVFYKKAVVHHYVTNFSSLRKKYSRNIALFFNQFNVRKYKYDLDRYKLLWAIVLMLTVVYPLYQSIIMYLKRKDLAAFWHPLVCLLVVYIYSLQLVKVKLLKQ